MSDYRPEYYKEYYKRNRDKILARGKVYRATRPNVWDDKARAAKAACYRKKPEQYKATNRRGTLRRNYGITPDDYATMLREQKGRCAICRRLPPKGKQLCVDHCHTTKRIRGLLCSNCNTAIGFLKEKPDLLYAAMRYVIKHTPVCSEFFWQYKPVVCGVGKTSP